MHSTQEALVHERIQTAEHGARQARLAAHLVASRRWRRLERLARVAQQRHEQRVRSLGSNLD